MSSSLQSTEISSSVAVNGNTVWHAGNDGRGSSLNVQTLWGYNLDHLNVRSRTTAIDLRGADRTKYWPMLFNQSGWGSGIMEMSVRKSSVHQGGGGAGCLYGRFRYRTTQWGHHSTFWEMEDNWGGGFNYPYIAGMSSNGQNNQSVIYLRGDTLYYYMFDNNADAFYDTAATEPKTQTESNGAVNTRNALTSVFIPSNARYFQKHILPRTNNTYNLGDASYRWSTVFATAENNTSDARKKENYGLVLGTDFLRKLKARTYIRRAPYMLPGDIHEDDPRKLYPDGENVRSIGFIAQEVKEVLDELGIAEEDFAAYDGREPNHLSLMYSEFIPILINSLQEKQKKIQEIKSRIEKLEGN